MASSLLLRRVNPSPLLNKLSSHIQSCSVARDFATDTLVTNIDDRDSSVALDRSGSSSDSSPDFDRGDRSVSTRGDGLPLPSLFSDVFDPFSPTRTLGQIFNLMDQMVDPFLSPSRIVGSTGLRRGWNVKEDNEAMYLKIDMPGVDKDKVKITVDQNTLTIRGEAEKESEDEPARVYYTGRLDLPPGGYKLDEIKAELKNGVLKVVVPKVQEEHRDVREVNVE